MKTRKWKVFRMSKGEVKIRRVLPPAKCARCEGLPFRFYFSRNAERAWTLSFIRCEKCKDISEIDEPLQIYDMNSILRNKPINKLLLVEASDKIKVFRNHREVRAKLKGLPTF